MLVPTTEGEGGDDTDSEADMWDEVAEIDEETLVLATLDDVAFDMDTVEVEEENGDDYDEDFESFTLDDVFSSLCH